MKKLLMILLLFSLMTYSQEITQFERVYTKVQYTYKAKQKTIKAKNIVIFNYANSTSMKIYMSNNTVRFFKLILIKTDLINDDGFKYDELYFEEFEKPFKFKIKLFNKRELGCLFLFEDDNYVRFIE